MGKSHVHYLKPTWRWTRYKGNSMIKGAAEKFLIFVPTDLLRTKEGTKCCPALTWILLRVWKVKSAFWHCAPIYSCSSNSLSSPDIHSEFQHAFTEQKCSHVGGTSFHISGQYLSAMPCQHKKKTEETPWASNAPGETPLLQSGERPHPPPFSHKSYQSFLSPLWGKT